MDRQRAHHHGGHGIAWNTEGHDHHQRARDIGAVRGFRRHDAFGNAGAEFFRPLGEFLGLVVGHDVGGTAPDRRQHADHDADEGAPEQNERAAQDVPKTDR
jgi:hypothetical protein